MRVSVDIRTPDGEVHSLGHGAILGRLWSADVQLNDGRVSEAHAMVSLRGQELQLLALRGRFRVDGEVKSRVVLRPGLRVSLAQDLDLEVLDVEVPSAVFALEAPGVPRQVLMGTSSLFGGARPRIRHGWDPDADAHVWPTGERWVGAGWSAPDAGTAPQPLEPGDVVEVAGVPFTASLLQTPSAPATRLEVDLHRPLTLVARYDTAHVQRADEPVLVFTGFPARILSELVTAGVPMAWEDIARGLWGRQARARLRRRWDMHLVRIRQRLRLHGIRDDLVSPDGSGLVELVLGPQDRIVDET